MIDTYADGRPVPAAFSQKPAELAARHLVVLGEIAGIDAHLVGHRGGGNGHFRGEMDIGYQGDTYTHGVQAGLDLSQGLHFSKALGGQADEAASCPIQLLTLGYSGINIVGVAVAHTLHDYWTEVVTDMDISYICSNIAHGY